MSAVSAIIVTESIKADVLSLPIIFKQIQSILGTFPASSVIVLGTKKNDCNSVFSEIKTKKILETLSSFGVPARNFIEFYTPCPEIGFNENQINSSQYSTLQNIINSCPKVPLQSIAQKQNQISNRASQIQKERTTIKIEHKTKDEVRYRTEKQAQNVTVPY